MSKKNLIPVNRQAIRDLKGKVTSDTNTYNVDLDLINPDNVFNCREDYGDLEELAENILQNGLIDPLKGMFVEKNGKTIFDLTDGFRRYAAIKILVKRGCEVGKIPCRIKIMSQEERLLAMFITQDNKKLSDIEVAHNFKRLVNLGVTPQIISDRLVKSITYVKDMLILASAPEKLKAHVKAKRVSSTASIKLIKTKGADEASDLIEASVNDNKKLKVSEAEILSKPEEQKKTQYELNLVMPETLEGMIKLRDELLGLKTRNRGQLRTLTLLEEKIKEQKSTDKLNGQRKSFQGESKFDTILETEFKATYIESIGVEKCDEIYIFFKTRLNQ